MRALSAALALFALSACTRTDTEALPRASAPDTAAARPAPESRAEAAGLDAGQAAALERLGVPVYVPDLPDGWTLTEATSRLNGDSTAFRPEYLLRVRTSEQTCLVLVTLSEGPDEVFLFKDPPNERDVRVPGVPVAGPVRIGWGVAGERTEGWEDGRVSSDWFGTDGQSFQVRSGDGTDGCRPASPEAAETFIASLRPLDPADDAIVLRPFQSIEVIPVDEPTQTPESAVRATFGPAEPRDREPNTTVETLRQRDRFAVVLATTLGLADDSVRDERTRYVVTRGAHGWQVASAGRQVRCQPGRGPSGWSADVCA